MKLKSREDKTRGSPKTAPVGERVMTQAEEEFETVVEVCMDMRNPITVRTVALVVMRMGVDCSIQELLIELRKKGKSIRDIF